MTRLLYSLFTFDCETSHENFQIVKFADDTTASGYILNNDESDYRDQVDSVASWCNENDLLLNVNKTKELIVDFRRKANVKAPLIIQGTNVEIVNSFLFPVNF